MHSMPASSRISRPFRRRRPAFASSFRRGPLYFPGGWSSFARVTVGNHQNVSDRLEILLAECRKSDCRARRRDPKNLNAPEHAPIVAPRWRLGQRPPPDFPPNRRCFETLAVPVMTSAPSYRPPHYRPCWRSGFTSSARTQRLVYDPRSRPVCHDVAAEGSSPSKAPRCRGVRRLFCWPASRRTVLQIWV